MCFHLFDGDEKGDDQTLFALALCIFRLFLISLRFDIEVAFYIPALYVFNVDDYFRDRDGLALSNHVILKTYFDGLTGGVHSIILLNIHFQYVFVDQHLNHMTSPKLNKCIL